MRHRWLGWLGLSGRSVRNDVVQLLNLSYKNSGMFFITIFMDEAK